MFAIRRLPGVETLEDPDGLESQAQAVAFIDTRRGFEAGVPEGVMRMVERVAGENSTGVRMRQKAIDIAMDNAQRIVPALFDHFFAKKIGPTG